MCVVIWFVACFGNLTTVFALHTVAYISSVRFPDDKITYADVSQCSS